LTFTLNKVAFGEVNSSCSDIKLA